MKTSEAEKLICPFIINKDFDGNWNKQSHINCITTKCMAWKMIKTKSDTKNEQYVKELGYRNKKEMAFRKADLKPEDCEGHCQRLLNN